MRPGASVGSHAVWSTSGAATTAFVAVGSSNQAGGAGVLSHEDDALPRHASEGP